MPRTERSRSRPGRACDMKRYLALCLCFAFVSTPARADVPDVKPVTVPFELLSTKHIVVSIKINGKGPYRVIFDTGSPVTFLNNKVAKESRLLKHVKKPAVSLLGG